jgi:hypothetical protein
MKLGCNYESLILRTPSTSYQRTNSICRELPRDPVKPSGHFYPGRLPLRLIHQLQKLKYSLPSDLGAQGRTLITLLTTMVTLLPNPTPQCGDTRSRGRGGTVIRGGAPLSPTGWTTRSPHGLGDQKIAQ